MIARSWLFVPGDSERKLARAATSAADALILDLEDSVARERLPEARVRVAAVLAGRPPGPGPQLWVRVNGAATPEGLADLVAVMRGAPDGIVAPKVSSAQEIAQIHHFLSALEAREGLELGATRLLPIATETARAVLGLDRLAAAAGAEPAAPLGAPSIRRRLAGLTWGAEDLAAQVGALANASPDGTLAPVFELARALCLVAAAAAGVPAIDGVHAEFRDRAGLERELARARRDGFAGKLAIHPDQIDAINAAFTPSESELAQARRIVAAFAAAPGLGVASLDGRMIDRPHRIRAERLLAAAAELAREPSRRG